MKKKAAQLIREVTEVLGTCGFSPNYATVVLSGEDALLSGYGKYPRKEEFDREKEYEFEMPVFIANTREKELKRAYQLKGEEGIREIVAKEHKKRVIDTGLLQS